MRALRAGLRRRADLRRRLRQEGARARSADSRGRSRTRASPSASRTRSRAMRRAKARFLAGRARRSSRAAPAARAARAARASDRRRGDAALALKRLGTGESGVERSGACESKPPALACAAIAWPSSRPASPFAARRVRRRRRRARRASGSSRSSTSACSRASGYVSGAAAAAGRASRRRVARSVDSRDRLRRAAATAASSCCRCSTPRRFARHAEGLHRLQRRHDAAHMAARRRSAWSPFTDRWSPGGSARTGALRRAIVRRGA